MRVVFLLALAAVSVPMPGCTLPEWARCHTGTRCDAALVGVVGFASFDARFDNATLAFGMAAAGYAPTLGEHRVTGRDARNRTLEAIDDDGTAVLLRWTAPVNGTTGHPRDVAEAEGAAAWTEEAPAFDAMLSRFENATGLRRVGPIRWAPRVLP